MGMIRKSAQAHLAAPETPAAHDEAAPQASTAESANSIPALAARLKVRHLEQVRDHAASARFLEHVPIAYARRHQLLGLAAEAGAAMPVVLADLSAWDCLDVLGRWLDTPIEPVLAPAEEIAAAINHAYQQRSGEAEAVIAQLGPHKAGDRGTGEFDVPTTQAVLDEAQRLAGNEDLLDVDSRAPVIKLVNLILFEAVKISASDAHVHPYEDKVVVRLRIDGVLFDAFELPKALHEEMVSRIKVMGRMDIAEKRLPQDGRATVQVGDRVIDLRLSAVPASCGERIVIRLLDKSARLYTLEELGMPAHTLASFRDLINVEHGLLLVTGPTGSGKSTTLYAALQQLNSTESNVITLEDPIEYQLPGVSQIQVATRKGMSFASGLRSVLRQDPDIIMVGEIRDQETAVLGIQSALTGHLVFSTLHTNDAASAVTRLLDLGIEPYLVASSVIGVMAQRLVRRVCDHCAQPVPGARQQLQRIEPELGDVDTSMMRRGRGCEQCRQTGYRGRIGLFELLVVGEAIREQVQQRANAAAVRRVALTEGMQGLADDGLAKVLSGSTTVEEVLRVTMRSARPA